MKTQNIIVCALVTPTLLACSLFDSDKKIDDVDKWIESGVTLEEARTTFINLGLEALDVYDTEGATLLEDLPTDLPGDEATYTGMISGGDDAPGSDGAAEPQGDVTHYANLSLTVNFADNTLTGEATDFVTNVEGFENPTGTVDIDGDILSVGDFAGIDLSGIGLLEQGDSTANWEISTSPDEAGFAGADGRVLGGYQITDIDWLEGPNAETTDISDGLFAAERD